MNIFSKLFKKESTKPKIKTVTTCSKHGAVPDWSIRCDDKVYPACWHCVGEFASQYVTRKTIEAQEKC